MEEALRTAVANLHVPIDPDPSEVGIVAVDAAGNHGAVTTATHMTRVLAAVDMDDHGEGPRRYLPPRG